jgi:hypothetical protein
MRFLWMLMLFHTCFGSLLTNTSFSTFLLEYTTLTGQTDIIIDSRCARGGLYRGDGMCVRTFSPGCAGGVGLVVDGRCRRRVAPIWNATGPVNPCAEFGYNAYLDLNATRAAQRQKGLRCIVVTRLQPSPNLMNYGAAQQAGESDAAVLGGGIGGGFIALLALAAVGGSLLRKRQQPPKQSLAFQQTNPLHAPKRISVVTRSPIQQLEYTRSDFKPMRARGQKGSK